MWCCLCVSLSLSLSIKRDVLRHRAVDDVGPGVVLEEELDDAVVAHTGGYEPGRRRVGFEEAAYIAQHNHGRATVVTVIEAHSGVESFGGF